MIVLLFLFLPILQSIKAICDESECRHRIARDIGPTQGDSKTSIPKVPPRVMIPPQYPNTVPTLTPPLLSEPTVSYTTAGPSTIEPTLASYSGIPSNTSVEPRAPREELKLTIDEVPTSYVILWVGIGAVSVCCIVGLYIGCRRMHRVPPPPSMPAPEAPWESEHNGGYDRIGY